MTDWTDPAAWYDRMNPQRPCDDFYLRLVLAASRVLDVGCGTGMLLKRARQEGHRGRLCGLDPDLAMLRHAQTWPGIEWVAGDAASAAWDQEFDLAVMTGHAFQELISDQDVRLALRAVRAALADGGRFAFETRHPVARAWERWDGASFEVTDPEGGPVVVSHRVLEVSGDVVRMTETLAGQWWDPPRTDEGSLRFLAPERLAAFLAEAGFVIENQYGDWDGGPVTAGSQEIITIACRA